MLQACKLKLGDIQGALLDTEFAMHDGEDNVKALFRQGQVELTMCQNTFPVLSDPFYFGKFVSPDLQLISKDRSFRVLLSECEFI